MYVGMYICIYIYTYMHMYIYKYFHIHIYIYAYTHAHTHTHRGATNNPTPQMRQPNKTKALICFIKHHGRHTPGIPANYHIQSISLVTVRFHPFTTTAPQDGQTLKTPSTSSKYPPVHLSLPLSRACRWVHEHPRLLSNKIVLLQLLPPTHPPTRQPPFSSSGVIHFRAPLFCCSFWVHHLRLSLQHKSGKGEGGDLIITGITNTGWREG